MPAVRIVYWIVAIAIAAVAVVFAVSNRHAMRLELWPLPFSLDLPVYLGVLGAMGLGVVLGALLAWLAQARWRRAARVNRRRAEALERELDAARKQPANDAARDAATGQALLPARSGAEHG